MKIKLQTGQAVTIYHDPLTEQKPEGTAELIEFLGENTMFENWVVRFRGSPDEPTVERRIKS